MLPGKLNLFILFLFISQISMAQLDSTPYYLSPYSIFGVGDLQNNNMVQHRGMGNASVASMGENLFSMTNPASYGMVKRFAFSTAIDGMFYRLENASIQYQRKDFQIPYLAMVFALNPDNEPEDTAVDEWNEKHKWALSVGVTPFSKISYAIKLDRYVLDSVFMLERLTGIGGLSRAYIGSSYQVSKNLFIGSNISYIFGNTQVNHVVNFDDSSAFYDLWKTSITYINGLGVDGGFIWGIPLKKSDLNLAASVRTFPLTNAKMDVTSYSLGNGLNFSDSILNYSADKGNYKIPTSFTFGLNWHETDSWQIALDATYQPWSKFTKFGVNDSLNNLFQLNAGWEFVPGLPENPELLSGFGSYLRTIKYRFGYSYAMTFYNVGGISPTDMRATLGFGFPVSSRRIREKPTYIDFSVELGKLGNLLDVPVTKEYVIFSLGFNIIESDWFGRRRIE